MKVIILVIEFLLSLIFENVKAIPQILKLHVALMIFQILISLSRLIPPFLNRSPEVVNVCHINSHEEESLLSVKNHSSPNCG